MCTCVCAVISECHQGRGLVVILCSGEICIILIDTKSLLKIVSEWIWEGEDQVKWAGMSHCKPVWVSQCGYMSAIGSD